MAWLTLINALFLPGKPILGSTGIALRDNIEAGHRAAAGAPIGINAGWHPYDRTVISGTETGLIYDFGVHGAVSAIDTPDFEDGFEYALVVRGLSRSGAIGTELILSLYLATSASWAQVFSNGGGDPTATQDAYLEILTPRIVSRIHPVNAFARSNGSGEVNSAGSVLLYNATAQKIGKARLSSFSATIDDGKVYLYRRGISE